LLKQLLTLSAGEGAARGLHALAFFVLARRTGPAEMGAFGLAQSIALYGVLAVQRGLEIPATLRTVREPERAGALRAALLALRLPVFAGLTLLALAWGDPLLTAMAGLWLASALQVRWLLLARQHSGAVAAASLLAAGAFAAAAVAGLPLVWVAVALSAGELAGAAMLWFAAHTPLERPGPLTAEVQREAWPYLGALLAGNLLYSLDVFVLGAVKGDREVGLYLAAYRLITAMSPVLGALQSSALPYFGQLYPDAPAARALARRVAARSTAVAAVVAAALAASAGWLVPFLYGEAFRPAAGLAPFFAAALVAQVPRMVFRQSLLAFGGQRADLVNVLLAVAVNAALDAVLAPAYGAWGCAVATLCTESAMLLFTLRACRRRGCA
jgi:O-antigen/teichoic acid export membrane protein